MGIKVTADYTCDGCGKNMKANSRQFSRRRGGYFIELPEVWSVKAENSEVRVTRGFTVYDTQDKDQSHSICCSAACAIKVATGPIAKLKNDNG